VAKVAGAATQPTTMAATQPAVAGAPGAAGRGDSTDGGGRRLLPPRRPVPRQTRPRAPTQPPPPPPMMTYEQWHIGPILIGQFLAALLNFVILAASVFFMIVKVVGWMSKSIQENPPLRPAITTRNADVSVR